MVAATPTPTAVPTRDQIAVEETWDLSGIYADDASWEADVRLLATQLQAATAHRGMLGDSAMALVAALDDAMAAQLTVERLMTYAVLRRDEDTTDSAAAARYERATKQAVAAGEALAFVEPELLALPADRLAALAADPVLGRYRHMLDDTQRRRPHVRSVEVEEVLAQAADTTRAASDAFTALDNADLDFGTVRDEAGREIALTKGRAGLLLESRDRAVRKAAHDAQARAYLDHRHTLAALHGASVRKDIFFARVRGHASARAAALFGGNIPESVYDSLIAAVREATPALERFLGLRKRALGLDELANYDLRVPLAPTPQRRYEYREAVELVLDGLAVLGDRYVEDLAAGFDARWVDVHETRGKRSGAYSWGAYGSSPVILMNWNGTLNDVFTLAHEAGHAMHSFYADAAQPYHDAGYPIFLAEVASTVNETLLLWHLLGKTPADVHLARFELLNRLADDVYATLITQAMFAEFEHRTHARAEAGEPLTADALDALFGELQAAYLPGVVVDDAARIRWGRIPHFYRAFYVYQYATGLSAAITLARGIQDGEAGATERYLEMLAAGGSDYPLAILQRAGVDLTTPEPVRTALAEFANAVAEMEQLADAGVLAEPVT